MGRQELKGARSKREKNRGKQRNEIGKGRWREKQAEENEEEKKESMDLPK